MEYTFGLAVKDDLPSIHALIDQRIRWMDKVGIRQWNVTDYQTVYPESHYVEQLAQNHLYVLRRSSNRAVVAAAALYDADPRWPQNDNTSAYYVHHFVADRQEKGAGATLLRHLEELALLHEKSVLRLDCPSDSPRLNLYYQQKGYIPCGFCVDGKYKGNLKEKSLK